MIRPTFDPYHKKCLSFAPGLFQLVARPCTGESSQLWSYDGTYLTSDVLINHQEVCLTAQPGEALQAWPCNGGKDNSQKFDRYFDTLVLSLISLGVVLCLNR